MIHKVVISDRSFNVIAEIQDKINNLKWEYNRIGGCGAFSFNIDRRFCREIEMGTNFNIKIYRRNPSTDVYDLWYQGRIENKIANVKNQQEVINVKGMGYQSALSDIYVDRDYSSKTVEFMVEDILDNDVVPNTDIIKDTISATGLTADTWEVNTNALNAIKSLAEYTGTREWGVDKDRKFFFKVRSSTVGFIQPFGRTVLNFSTDSSYKEIVNRVVIIGGDVGGSPFSRTVNDLPSQTKHGRRDRVVQNSAIVTNAVADQFGNALLAEFKDIVRRAKIELLDEQLIEVAIPIPLFQMRPRGRKWGEFRWGEALWSGLIDYQINRIQYKLDNQSNLKINIQLGVLTPDIAENINQLAFRIDQVRQQGV